MLLRAGFIFGLFIPGWLFDYYWLDGERAKSYERLIRIYDEVDLGEDYDSVAKKIIANITMESVYVPSDEKDTRWIVTSASFDLLHDGEWVLNLCFVDGQLNGLFFGIADQYDHRPQDAPLPKGKMCR